MVDEVDGPNYKRDEFLVTLKSLKDSVDDNSKLEQTELKAIYDCLKESSTFLKKLANSGTSGTNSDAAVASDVSSTPIDTSSTLFKPMITLLANISDHTNHAAEEAFKIRNIMMGSSDIAEAYEKNFGSQMGFSETKSIRDQLSSPAVDVVEDSKAKEDKADANAQQSKLGKMFKSMNGYLKDLVGKGKKIAKVGIIATLTALGLIWLLKFMETDTWKTISSAVSSFINTGLPIIVKTIDFIVSGVVGLFTAIKAVWDNSVGWVLNKVGGLFGVTREDEETGKQVGFLGDGIGLLIVAFAGLALAAKATALAMSPMKTLGGAAKKIGGLFGGGGAKSVASSVTSAATGGSDSMSIPQMGSKSGGGWTSKLAGGAKNLGKGIADLGKGIGKGLGKLIELTLKGLAAGLKALGNSAVIKGAFAMGILGVAMIPFAIAVNKFSRANWKGLGIAISGMGAMAAAAFALGKVGKHVLVGSAAMVVLGLAMIPLSHAMQKFSTIDWVSIPKGIAALVAFSVAVGVLGAAMMTGIGALFFGAGVVAIAALGAGLLVFGAGAKSMADGVNDIVPSISRLAKLDTKKLQKVEPALKAVAAGLWSFSKSSLGSTFLSWVGKLFGKNSPIDNIQRLAKSAPNISLLSHTLGKLGDQLRDFGKKASGFKADQIEEFIDAIDHDEASDMLALGKMLESMGKVDFTGLSNVNLKNLELPKLEDKLVATYVKFFNKLMEVFDKWPNNFAWPGAVPMESAGTAPPIRRQPIATGDGVVVPRVSTTVKSEAQTTKILGKEYTKEELVQAKKDGTVKRSIADTHLRKLESKGARRTITRHQIAKEDWAPGDDLSEKQYSTLSMAVRMGNKLSPEKQKAYDKYEGKIAPAVLPSGEIVPKANIAVGKTTWGTGNMGTLYFNKAQKLKQIELERNISVAKKEAAAMKGETASKLKVLAKRAGHTRMGGDLYFMDEGPEKEKLMGYKNQAEKLAKDHVKAAEDKHLHHLRVMKSDKKQQVILKKNWDLKRGIKADLSPVNTAKVDSVIPKTMANKVPTVKLSENAVKVTVPMTTKGLPASVPANAQSIIEGKFGPARHDLEYEGAVMKFAKEQGWIGPNTKAKFTAGQIVLPGLPLTDLQNAAQRSKASQNKVVKDGDKLAPSTGDWGDDPFGMGRSTRRAARPSQTGAMVRNGQSNLATAQQVAGASSGVNIGGNTSTQVDNSKHETLHVAKSSSSDDPRMTMRRISNF